MSFQRRWIASDSLKLVSSIKRSYYDMLERCSQGWHEETHDAFTWISYFWGGLLTAYKEYEQRVGTLRSGRGAKGDQVRVVSG
jgi:hypothetical protein